MRVASNDTYIRRKVMISMPVDVMNQCLELHLIIFGLCYDHKFIANNNYFQTIVAVIFMCICKYAIKI